MDIYEITTEEIFELERDDKPMIKLRVTDLRKHCYEQIESGEGFNGFALVETDITGDLIEHVQRNSIDGHKVGVICYRLLVTQYQDLQPMMIIMDAGKAWLVDGNHTALAMHRIGFESMPALVIEERIWRRYVL